MDAAKLALLEALISLVNEPLVYADNRIEITCASHSDAMERVRKARDAIAKAGGAAPSVVRPPPLEDCGTDPEARRQALATGQYGIGEGRRD